MAAPVIQAIYPNDNASGIPIGAELLITFDQSVDLRSVKSNVVMYGADFDRTSGPDSEQWVDKKFQSRYFLNSPGFNGTVELDYTAVYVDANGTVLEPQPTILSKADAANFRHKLIIQPKDLLAPEVNYKAYIIGNSEGGLNKGIASRSIYDVDYSAATEDTGVLITNGSYTGPEDEDTVFIKITTGGDIGAAKYKWWYEGAGENTATKGKATSRRYRRLEDGVQLRFNGSGFKKDDVYSFKVCRQEYLADSFTLNFDTGTGSIVDVPESASTSIIGTENNLIDESIPLTIVDIDPPDGSTHMPINGNRKIMVQFSGPIDPATITEETVTLQAYPVSGRYGGDEPKELVKKLTVQDDILIIEI